MVDSNSYDNAHEISEGLLVTDGPFITGGAASPVGLNLPQSTVYIQTLSTGVFIWRKFGSSSADWRILSAQDIFFDNTFNEFESSQCQEAIEEALSKARASRFQYIQFQLIGQMNYDQYLYSFANSSSSMDRRSNDNSNGYQYTGAAPLTVAFDGNIEHATASIRGIAQSTGSPSANIEVKFELWKCGFNNVGTKLGDIIFNVDSSLYTIGNWWNSSIVTAFGEEQDQDVDVNAGDLLGLKFIKQIGSDKAVSIENTTIVLEIVGADLNA